MNRPPVLLCTSRRPAVGWVASFTVRQPLVVLESGFAFGSYLFLYTPLKRKTTLNTLVGAVPGAMPPAIGWTAATDSVEPAAGVLFERARGVLRASLIYLPALLTLWLLYGIPHGYNLAR